MRFKNEGEVRHSIGVTHQVKWFTWWRIDLKLHGYISLSSRNRKAWELAVVECNNRHWTLSLKWLHGTRIMSDHYLFRKKWFPVLRPGIQFWFLFNFLTSSFTLKDRFNVYKSRLKRVQTQLLDYFCDCMPKIKFQAFHFVE